MRVHIHCQVKVTVPGFLDPEDTGSIWHHDGFWLRLCRERHHSYAEALKHWDTAPDILDPVRELLDAGESQLVVWEILWCSRDTCRQVGHARHFGVARQDQDGVDVAVIVTKEKP